MSEKYVTFDLEQILIGVPLPVSVYVYVDLHFIIYRAAGDKVDRVTFDRLQFKKLQYLFVRDSDEEAFRAWIAGASKAASLPEAVEEDTGEIVHIPEPSRFSAIRAETRETLLSIFQADHPEKIVRDSLLASRKLVDEVSKFPYAVKPLSQLHGQSKGTIDHSVNVSILAVYLAMQMGYTHGPILQHVGAGALLHDVGKPLVPIEEDDSPEVISKKMEAHPQLGRQIIESEQAAPHEVRMIIGQHHENFDGSGYPDGLRAGAIYDLSRIVAIANTFDDLVNIGQGSLKIRQKEAIQQMDRVLFKKFDPQKLDKALKILKRGV